MRDPSPGDDWLRIAAASSFGLRRVYDALDAFGGAAGLAHASRDALRARIGHRRGTALHRRLRDAKPATLRRRAEALEMSVLTPADAAWPGVRLAHVDGSPHALFVQGTLPPAGARTLAIVGTRKATAYGLGIARELAAEAARAGLWVVSGFALGIDAAAHEGALSVTGGRTLAVLGAGIDIPYPAGNARLRERVPSAGGFLSEYGPGTRPGRHTFPPRNRLVAAYAEGVVVVEAPERSGAMITARLAGDQGREVLAVPGHVRRTTQAGCHALLRRGMAHICTGIDDVFAALEIDAERTPRPVAELTGPASAVYEHLDPDTATDLDAICIGTGLTPSAVTIALTRLELESLVRRVPGVGYLRT